jgi:4-amino-4-deoxy-L-arabinose transferase-like glycosyltransferase
LQETVAPAEQALPVPGSLLDVLGRRLSLSTSAFVVASALIVGLAAYLRFYRLGEGGLGNSFYAAAVRSMTESWHNFFYVSFDPLAAYMVDKPPVGLWLQAASAHFLGYDGFALMLPQAAAGVASVLLLLLLTRRLHGDLAGLFAAATLAVLPASVLVARNNTMDSVLVALVLGAIALAVRAGETGRVAWLLLAAVAGGIAFNVKGFEAMLALPGLLLFFMLTSRLPFKKRLLHLAAAGVVFAVVGLSWTAAVALTPSDSRPLVLNSDGNSIWSLTFGYNGFDRLFGGEGFNPATALTSANPEIVPIGILYGGKTGPLRLLGEFPGPLVAMMLPIAAAGALLLLYDLRHAARRGASLLWLLWLVAGVAAFSLSRLGSAHYLESFAPALAACVGFAASAAVSGPLWRRGVGLAGIAGSGFYAMERLDLFGEAGGAIRLLGMLAIAFVAIAFLSAVALRLLMPRFLLAAGGPALVACVLVLVVPFLVSREAVRAAPVEGILPGTVFLSLDKSREPRLNLDQPIYFFVTGEIGYLARPLEYLERQRQEGQYAAAITSFYTAGPIIARHGLPVLPLHSEFRQRAEYPIEDLRGLLDSGRLAHFMVSLGRLDNVFPEAAALIRERCRDVSRQAGAIPQIGVQVYRCQ